MPHYEHVHEYLTWVRKALAHARKGGSVRTYWNTEYTGPQFEREFLRALHARINHKGNLPVATKVPQQIAVYHGDGKGKVWSAGGRIPQNDAYSYIGWRNLGDAEQIKATRYRVHFKITA